MLSRLLSLLALMWPHYFLVICGDALKSMPELGNFVSTLFFILMSERLVGFIS